MKVRFKHLRLTCKESEEFIDLDHHISFFHGQISAGKSSIARLIDYCLGGNIENTPAIKQELVSAELMGNFNKSDIIFERKYPSNQIQVTWIDKEGKKYSVLAPKEPNNTPIWGEDVYNLSDLIFNFLGLSPLKVRRSKSDPGSPLIRLSFRDFMWYCYLDQDNLDSSFYKLEDQFRKLKSRDVMKFIVGYYNEKLNGLEIQLEKIKKVRLTKKETIKQIISFVNEYGFKSVKEIEDEMQKITNCVNQWTKKIQDQESIYLENTHFVDELRDQLRDMDIVFDKETQIKKDLEYKIDIEKSLESEMISSKFKMARHETASHILSGVKFEICPECGLSITPQQPLNEDVCPLCKNKKIDNKNSSLSKFKPMYDEINSKITELGESIKRHEEAYKKQLSIIEELKEEKLTLDKKLNIELKSYDSAYITRIRELERNIATNQEKYRNIEKIYIYLKSIDDLRVEVKTLEVELDNLENEIKNERSGLTNAQNIITEIQDFLLETLTIIKVPGLSKEDQIEINLKTWIPSIFPQGEKSLKWDFYNAGSGGKKTLLNVSYALSIHKITEKFNLPLPTFLIIDTPMKNIGEEINQEIFKSFYSFLYKLAEEEMLNTQFIIIDKEFIPPESKKLDVHERLMTPDKDENPPLFKYYRGP